MPIQHTSLVISVVVFDIDGTLILTGGAGLRALRRALEDFLPGLPFPGGYQPHGKTDKLIFVELFQAMQGRAPTIEEEEELERRYLSLLPEELDASAHEYRVLPGVLRLLDALDQGTATVGLGTGNFESGARMKLDRGALTNRFAFGGYGSDAYSRADILQAALDRASSLLGRTVPPGEAVFVGDTTRDIDAARAVGGRILAVATGPCGVDSLRDADLAVETLEDPRVDRWLLG